MGPIEWKPIAEYTPSPNVAVTDLVLLGWYQEDPYASGMIACGVGWLDRSGKWIDSSDKKAWPHDPTHFACSCRDIPMAEREHHPRWKYG